MNDELKTSSVMFVFFSASRTTSRSQPSGRGMQLGTKGKNVDIFVDQLKSEGENVVNPATAVSSSAGVATKQKTQSVSMSDADKGE